MNDDRHDYMDSSEIQDYLCAGELPGVEIDLGSGERREFDQDCYDESGGTIWRWIVTSLFGR